VPQGMARFILHRLALGALAIVGVSIVTFVGARLSGDPTYLLLPPNATEADIERIRHDLGLDRSIPEQYVTYVANAVRGDFGNSLKYQVPAWELVEDRIWPTLQLTVPAFLISLLLGTILGVVSAWRRGTIVDKSVTTFGLFGQAMPNFWVAIMLILVFSVELGWLPTSGRGGIEHYVLPTIALSWLSTAAIMRLTRSSMLNVLESDFVKFARLKGLSERKVIWKHAFRNSLVTVVTYAGLMLATLLGGAVIIEQIFAWPGLGSLMVTSVYARDFPVVQAGVFFASIVFVLASLVVDVLYGVIDPRIRHGRSP
jgi:peptide/nickel transport system permease protein